MKNILTWISLTLLLGACQKEFLETNEEKQFNTDTATIKDYVAKQANASAYKAHESGLYYALTNANPTGKALGGGFVATFKYELSLLNGVRIDSSTATAFFTNTAYMMNVKNFSSAIAPNVVGLTQALFMSKEGESGTFLIPSAFAFGNATSGILPANSVLRLDLKAISYKDEEQQIEEYLTANKLQAEKTSTGLRYVRLQEGKGDATIKSGTSVEVNYSGKLLANGKEFDKGTFTFVAGTKAVIDGFDEGVLKMKIGEKARLILPQASAYKAAGSGTTIPPYATLVFDIEAVK